MWCRFPIKDFFHLYKIEQTKMTWQPWENLWRENIFWFHKEHLCFPDSHSVYHRTNNDNAASRRTQKPIAISPDSGTGVAMRPSRAPPSVSHEHPRDTEQVHHRKLTVALNLAYFLDYSYATTKPKFGANITGCHKRNRIRDARKEI